MKKVEPYTPELLAVFPGWCGSEGCRGTLLSPNEDGDVPGKDKQKKKDKKVKEMLAALKNGDRVCTIGGIYGTITSIKDDTIELSVGRDNVKLVFARWAIRNVEEVAIENDSEVLN